MKTENLLNMLVEGRSRAAVVGWWVGRISVAGGKCPSVLNRNSRGTKKMGKHWAQPAQPGETFIQFRGPEAALTAGTIR